ncbi:MAG TPA: hypothetical protein VF041_22390 [Gemmatimonadaceae bacterium]
MPGPRSTASGAAALLALATALAPPGARAQSASDQPVVPTLHYQNGRLREAYLPAGRAFAIDGSMLTTGGMADVVLARMWETGRRRARDGAFPDRAAAPIDSACWMRAPESEANTFDLAFRPLRLGRRYRFELSFVRRYDPATLEDAVARATETLRLADALPADSAAGSAPDSSAGPAPAPSDGIAPSTRAARAALSREIARALEARTGERTLWLRVTGEGDCAVDTTAPPLDISPEALGALSRAVAHAAALESDAADARAAEAAILDTLASISDSDLVSLEARLLRAAEHRRGVRRPVPYDSDDATALVAAARARDVSLLSAGAAERLQRSIARPVPTPPLGSATGRLLARVLGPVEALRAKERDEARAADALDAVRRREREAWGTVSAGLRRGYTPVARAGAAATAWGAETEVRRLQIGSALGGAYARMGFSGPAADGDGFLFAAVRFYLAPVDRTRPVPWSSALARFSIDVGSMIRSTLHRAGEEQETAFAGLSPTLGVSWDARRFLALSAGLLVYRHPEDSGGRTGRLAAATYIGVSTDLDAFNRVHDLLK